jgi:Flp pilus assembly pilin Flp
MFRALRAAVRNEGGASVVEYALLLALVALVVITAAQSLGTALSGFFSGAAGSV